MEITRVHKASTSPTGIKYKFGVQVLKGIKNAINLDKKNGNILWEEAIKSELKQLTDYETFIVLDSWEDIAICGLQRIKGNILVRFEPTNLRIVYLKNYLRKLKYVYLNSWVRQ
jgi:hypothetical protein